MGPIVKTPTHHDITGGSGINGFWINPVPNDLVIGNVKKWAAKASVTPIRIPGYWLHKKGVTISAGERAKPGEKVVLALHGGAYIRMSAHPSDPTAAIAKGLLKHIGSVERVLSVEYRLSSAKPWPVANPFPSALLDAFAGYHYLISEVGFAPSDIIVEGDSAGGNLAHALTRYLVDNQNALGFPAPPGALVLLSPWVDLSASHEGPGTSAALCESTDYIGHGTGGDYAKVAFLGLHGMHAAEHNPYISPSSLHPAFQVSFAGFPRTFIVGGAAEVLIDQIRTLKDRMIADLGEGNGVLPGEGKVRYYEASGAVHDYILLNWHEPERTDTLAEIAKWVLWA